MIPDKIYINECVAKDMVCNPYYQPSDAIEYTRTLLVFQNCPNCDNSGSYANGDEQCQCEFCYTNPYSIFNYNILTEQQQKERSDE